MVFHTVIVSKIYLETGLVNSNLFILKQSSLNVITSIIEAFFINETGLSQNKIFLRQPRFIYYLMCFEPSDNQPSN